MGKYLLLDACLGGTGIRDFYNGGYINPIELGLKSKTINLLEIWLSKYQNEFYNGFENINLVETLDQEGMNLTLKIESELKSRFKFDYYSDAKVKIIPITKVVQQQKAVADNIVFMKKGADESN